MTIGFLLGLAVAFGGALLLATGSELQSRAVYAAHGRWRAFLRAPRWLLGLLLLGVAVSTNFIALALTPVSAVQAMSVVALAASAAFGALTGRVLMTPVGAWSVTLCIIGILGFIAILATHPGTGAPALDAHAQFVVAALILVGVSLIGLCAAVFGGRGDRGWSRLLALLVGVVIFGSITTVFKTLVTLVLEYGPSAVLAAPGTLLGLACVAVGGLVANVLLQRSHRCFPAPVVVAALTIVDPLTAAVIGIAVLGEAGLTVPSSVGLVGCSAIACVGVVGASRLRRRAEQPDAASPSPEPRPAER